MCDFCDGNKTINNIKLISAEEHWKAELEIEFLGCYDCNGDTIYLQIDYCPMCGEKLEWKEEWGE